MAASFSFLFFNGKKSIYLVPKLARSTITVPVGDNRSAPPRVSVAMFGSDERFHFGCLAYWVILLTLRLREQAA
jgi:hypothetical protein